MIREKVSASIIKTEKIPTADQAADILTKVLGTSQHKKRCSQLSLFDMFDK